tara:strand:- start:1371 stop:2213 length:843 start_codon:yes stop_codon:yes gene_type:complete
MFKPLPVLDHGFVRIIDYMGDDAAIVQAARVSYGKGTTKVSDDAGLLNYLLRHRHSTPFEMCEIKYHIKLPIFIARQWIRHRTANVNEYSARYSVLDREFYIPDQVNLATQSKSNRQGRGEVLEGKEAAAVLDLLRDDAENNYNHYVEMLNEDESGHIIDETRDGLSRELARMNLTLNTYTQWYWKIDLHNLLHFLSLRADEHAQYEIRVYAEAIMETVKRWCPITYDAFIDHRINSVTLSGKAIQVIKKMIDGVSIDQEESGLSKREWRELMGVLEKLD